MVYIGFQKYIIYGLEGKIKKTVQNLLAQPTTVNNAINS